MMRSIMMKLGTIAKMDMPKATVMISGLRIISLLMSSRQ